MMRVLSLRNVFYGILLFSAATGYAQPGAWVFSGSAGMGVARSMHWDYTDAVSAAAQTTTANFNPGYHITAAVGYRRQPIQVELEWLHARSPRSDLRTTNDTLLLNTNGDVALSAALFNLLYHFNVGDSPIVPYLGAGVGLGRVRAQLNSTTFNNLISGMPRAAAYQAIAGARYQMTEHVATVLDYRYLTSANIKFDLREPDTGANHLGISSRYRSHTFNLGLVVDF